MQTHILGFPRIGRKRELKKALEGYWKGELSERQLRNTADELKKRHWKGQHDAGGFFGGRLYEVLSSLWATFLSTIMFLI